MYRHAFVSMSAAAVALSFFAAAPAQADGSSPSYDPPMGAARTDFGAALSICKGSLDGGPGMVSEASYSDYVEKRDRALKEDPNLPKWDKKTLGFVPKELFPKCEKLMSDYAAGVDAEKRPTINSSCSNNATKRMKSIIDTYYPEMEKKGAANVIVWFARKDLEAARYTMFHKGYKTMGATCATNDPFKKAFVPLKDQFARAEALVAKMEAAKGIKFGGVEGENHIVYIDLKTNQPVERSDRY